MNSKLETVGELILIVRDVKISAPSSSVVLIDGASFYLNKSSKVALVGSNGTGKSTLIKAIAGSVQLDEGEIKTAKKGQLVEYVPQFPPEELLDKTLVEVMTEYLLQKRGHLGEEWKVYTVLNEFRFDECQINTRIKDLSGGEINHALLARAVVTEPDILLLDEPTNHLDTEGVFQFEQILQNLEMPFLIISHDRELIDRFTTRTLFLEQGKIYSFNLPYSEAKQQLLEQKEALEKLRFQQEKRQTQIAENVKWLKDKAKKSDDMAHVYRAAQTKLKRFESEMVEIPKEQRRNISLKSTDFQGQFAMQIHHLPVRVPGTDGLLYLIEDMALTSGDRAVVMGVNGAGKTTLLESLVQAERNKDYPMTNEPGIRFNPQVSLGYYDQKQREMDLDQSLHKYIIQMTSLTSQQAHAALINAGFPYSRHQDPISLLSGGERARLQLLAINQSGTNFLILDEPTNHLDVEGIERLEQELMAFEGTVILVSHDRRFIETVGNHFFLIKDNKLQEVENTDVYYLHILETLEKAALARSVSINDNHSNFNDNRSELEKIVSPSKLAELSEDELYKLYFELEQEIRKNHQESKRFREISYILEQLEQRINANR